jgi:DNA-binding transcriptional MerR regulator
MIALAIGDLARATGTKVQTIRYYEEIGLIPAPARSAGNQRRYDKRMLDRLAFIRHARELGFTLGSIRELLRLADQPDQPCAEADSIARDRLVEVESRLKRLNALKRELNRMIKACAGGSVAQCQVIETLSDHRHCLHHVHQPNARS